MASTTATMKMLGGEICFDFTNTVNGWDGAEGVQPAGVVSDKLDAYSDLTTWGVRAGAIDEKTALRLERAAARDQAGALAVLERARALRGALYGVFTALVEKRAPSAIDLEGLNLEVAIAASHARLASGDEEGLVWTWDAASEEALDRVLWPIARSAADVATTSDVSRMRKCPAHRCGWLFFDTSRNRSRQWCDMQDCGNLAKVRRFRERKAGAQS